MSSKRIEIIKDNRNAMVQVLVASNNKKVHRSASLLELSSRPRREKEIKIEHCLRESVIKKRTGG